MKGHKIMNYKHITINERCCIANFLDLGWSLRKIAKHLNRNVSTISREVKRNSTNGKYLAHIACENYTKNRKNCPKTFPFSPLLFPPPGKEKRLTTIPAHATIGVNNPLDNQTGERIYKNEQDCC